MTIEHRYDRTPDGAIWGAFFAYGFWSRYLTVFDEVRVVARIRDVPSQPPSTLRADGPGVAFYPVPHYRGVLQYLTRRLAVSNAIRRSVEHDDSVILRVDSRLAADLEPELKGTGHPYAVEVVVDPYDVFARGAVRHPLRPFFRWYLPRQLRRQCANAIAASYVTEHGLQRRYPPRLGAYVTHYSSVELPPDAFVAAPRAFSTNAQITLVTLGTMEDLRKAQDIVVRALALCRTNGLDLRLILVGDGKYRPFLLDLGRRLGIENHIEFKGLLPAGPAVRCELDRADVAVLPSHGEGLPRAMIEAMARGLPGIGSTIAGYRELLPDTDLVPPGDHEALARKMIEVMTDPRRMTEMSSRNLAKAAEYREDLLRGRRDAFYRFVRYTTESWARTCH